MLPAACYVAADDFSQTSFFKKYSFGFCVGSKRRVDAALGVIRNKLDERLQFSAADRHVLVVLRIVAEQKEINTFQIVFFLNSQQRFISIIRIAPDAGYHGEQVL